jgi:hypothetical protein
MNTKVTHTAKSVSARSSILIGALVACAVLPNPTRAAGPDPDHESYPRRDDFRCNNETLRGNYGFTITGMRPAGPGGPLVAIVGTALTTFNGDGTFDQFDNINVGPPAVSYVPDRPGSGTYSLSPDCSGTMTLVAGGMTLQLAINVVDHGREIRTAVVTPNVIITSNGRRT